MIDDKEELINSICLKMNLPTEESKRLQNTLWMEFYQYSVIRIKDTNIAVRDETFNESPKDCEDWDLIVAAGYAKAGRKDRYGGRMYWLTREGLDWLGERLGITIHDEEE